MKLSWKLFFFTTPIFILFLTFFGSWTLQDSFENNLEQEMRRCMAENQIFQNSYEMIRSSLSEKQLQQVTTAELVESFHKGGGRKNSGTRVLNGNFAVLYQDTGLKLRHSIQEQLTPEQNVGYELVRDQGNTYLVVMCATDFGHYIETTSDISRLYTWRETSYDRYRWGMLVVSLAAGGVILLILLISTRNVQKLSGAVRQFAQGQYDTRVEIRSGDEIGTLARDFNWMADSMDMQMEKLQSEVERQEEFTQAFAHELKTPLTSIIGYADTIRQMDLTPEETDMCADYIYRQGKRLQSLSYKLLEMAMVGQSAIAGKELSAGELLKGAVETARPALEKRGVRAELQAEEGVLWGDRDLLSTVFINFLDNAGKASEPGSVITVTGREERLGYTVIVKDEGRGIPKEELSRITEAFYMVDKSRARKEGGAGLGLALCRKILDLHHALWKIESEPGRGTAITVCFRNPEMPRREKRKRRQKNDR